MDARFFIRRLASGNLLLVTHNPPDGISRSHLKAWLSEDDGRSWRGGLLLDERLGVSYPDGVQGGDGTVWIIYDYIRTIDREVYLARFTEADVLAGTWTSVVARERMLINEGS